MEQGHPGAGILQYLNVLGLEMDLLLAAKEDLLGRKLQDAGLTAKMRAPKRSKPGSSDKRMK